MIWQQPWAWVGAAAVLLPLLIHLLGFGRAPRHRFPTLRFIDVSRLLPARRTRIHDPWLLLLRSCIVLAAVAALAQPLFRSGERRARYAESLARVVVLDTSSSAQRATLVAGWRTDSSRSLARGLADQAQMSRVIETSDVQSVLVGASHWLSTHAVPRELVVLSDFQVGVLDTSAVRQVPSDIGLQLVRLGTLQSFAASTRATSEATTASFAAASDSITASPLLLMSADVAATASAALEAAWKVSSNSFKTGEDSVGARMRNVALVSGDYESRDSILANAKPLQVAWMLRLLHAIRSHPLVVAQHAQEAGIVVPQPAGRARISDRATASAGAVLEAAEGERDGQPILLLLLPRDASPVGMMSVMAALFDVLPSTDAQGAMRSRLAGLMELESATLPESVLRSWQRAPALEPSASDTQRLANTAVSDARWFWALVLILIGVEGLVRRRISRTRASNSEAASDQALDGARAA